MLELDQMTIIAGGIILVLTLIASIANPYLFGIRIPRKKGNDENQEGAGKSEPTGTVSPRPTEPSVSILLTAHDEAEVLKKNLPSFLNQNYGTEYQVIVVAESCDSETEEVLKNLNREYGDRLYYTLIPDSSRYMSRKKLQITLGVKAAKYEWILLTAPTCHPSSDEWLKAVAVYEKPTCHLVMGITTPDPETSACRRFDHLYTALPLLRQAGKSVPYRTNMPFVGFRKSEFMKAEGFRGNLQLIRGEFDFLVNKYAREGGTEVTLNPESWLTANTLSDKQWRDNQLFYIATRRELKRSRLPRFKIGLSQFFLHADFILCLGAIFFGILTQRWILAGCGLVGLLLLFGIRWGLIPKSFRQFGTTVPRFAAPFYELGLAWRGVANRLRYLRSDKNDFTSHKL